MSEKKHYVNVQDAYNELFAIDDIVGKEFKLYHSESESLCGYFLCFVAFIISMVAMAIVKRFTFIEIFETAITLSPIMLIIDIAIISKHRSRRICSEEAIKRFKSISADSDWELVETAIKEFKNRK